jgi:sortase A
MFVTPPQIIIPAAHVRAPIVESVSASSLAVGAGHYPGTGWPGQGKTIGLAGHDVTIVSTAAGSHVFGALANNYRAGRKLVGKKIILYWRGRKYVYRITKQLVVPPTRIQVLRNLGFERLVLTTCYPPHSSSLRLVTFARRVVWKRR